MKSTEYWNVDYKRRFCLDDLDYVSIEISTINIPMQKRNLIEKATEDYFNQVREILSHQSDF